MFPDVPEEHNEPEPESSTTIQAPSFSIQATGYVINPPDSDPESIS